MKCCICGTLRNCGKYINNVLTNMEKITTLFDDYVIILYYDHSDDDTLIQLQNYSLINPKLNLYVNTSPLTHHRTYNISKGRNHIINTIKESYSDFEYFIMMDCDEKSCGTINLNVLQNALNISDQWDSLSFNRTDYYDLWALSIDNLVFSCWHFKNKSVDFWQSYIDNVLLHTPEDKLVSCYSAFNGLAIYKTNKFINCVYDGVFRYDYIPPNLMLANIKLCGDIVATHDGQDCEHRHFHFQAMLMNGARNRISPQILFSEYDNNTQHDPPLGKHLGNFTFNSKTNLKIDMRLK